MKPKETEAFFWNYCENYNNSFDYFNNVLVFVLRVVFFRVIVYNVMTRYMYDAGRRDVALSASFVLECFAGSEVTTRKGNEPVVQRENCAVEETKEVELRSRRGKFIYNRTYNSVGLNKVSHFSRRGRAPSRLPLKKLKSLLCKTGKVRVFVWKGIRKNTPLSSKIHCYVNNGNGSDVNRYSSSCKSVRFLIWTSRKLVRKRGKVYLSSKHQRRGDLSGMRYRNRVLSKYLSLCSWKYPFYIAYKSLNHQVNFGQFKPSTDFYFIFCRCDKNNSCSILPRKRRSMWGKCWSIMCCNEFVHFK